MTKTRVPDGDIFWYVKFYNWAMVVDSITDCGCNDTWAREHFKMGNYFATKEEAEAMARKLRAVLNGADVIEMPSESEAENECERQIELSVTCDDKWTEEAYKDGFADCLHWLKTKVKVI